MSLLRSIFLFACASSLVSLSSCNLTGKADVVNPTVSELDRMDVQWGLEPRKSKGGPRRVYQYEDTGASAPASVSAPSPAPTIPEPVRERVNAIPPSISPEPPVVPAPSIPATLR
jgi:hypothetical protein